jgi:cytochrome c
MRSAVLLLGVLAASPAFSQTAPPPGNIARGKLVFLECQACHAVAPGAPALVGPNLAGVYGRKAAAAPSYDYSTALKASGLVWNTANLDHWLTDPSSLVPGTKMAFTGIAKPDLRADVIAYLATLK